MSKTYQIRLEENDLGQLLDDLEARAEAWEKTAHYRAIMPKFGSKERCSHEPRIFT